MYRGKLRFLTIAAAIGVVLSIVLAIWEVHLGNYTRALAEILFPLTAPILIYLLWRKPRYAQLVLQIFSLSVFIQQSSVGLYLFDMDQMIWIPTFPLVYFYLLGHKGWTWSLLLFVELWLFYFFYPYTDPQTVVAPTAMYNFMAAYVMTAFLSWMYSREILYYQTTISKRAHFDFLTGVYNRVAWLDRLEQEIAIQKRNSRLVLSIIMFDVDDFKKVNDDFGHHAGDKVLVDACRVMETRLRKSDVLGRWGGEEFVILLPDTTLAQAKNVAEQLRRQLQDNKRSVVRITASFGVTECHPGDAVDELLQRVDEQLYQAKATGKNCIVAA